MKTTTMTKKWIFALFCLLPPIVASAQEKDFGIWYGVSAEHKLNKKLEIDLLSNVRTFNNASKIEEAFIEGAAAYKFSKNLSISGSYRFTENLENDNSYYIQHKLFLDLKGNVPTGNFNFTGHLKFQTKIKTYIEDENDNYPIYTGRIKLKAEYKTPTFPVNPYIYSEMFTPMFSDKSGTIEKMRYSAGLDFAITAQHSVEVEYIFQRDYTPHISDMNIVSINWDIKF